MRILVLQHHEAEGPGIFRQFLAEDGHELVAADPGADRPLPALDGFDALWVMGGVMNTWEDDTYPWLKDEKALIREAVERRGMPYLGFCLGHQLLACALGGDCGRASVPEIGVLSVQLTEEGAAGVPFDGVPEEFPCLQWHGAEVTRLPEGARVLATSPVCAVQAMSWGPRALSLQFHLEADAATARRWTSIPEWRAALDAHFGPGGADRMAAACDARIHEMNAVAERVYINWLQAAAQA